MTCDLVRDRLDAYLRGDGAASDRDVIEAHLAGCAGCRADLDAARALAGPLATLPRALPPPRDLWTGIAPRLAPARAPGRVALPVWVLVAAALLLAVVSSGLTLLVAGNRATPPTVPTSFTAVEGRYLQTAVDLSDIYARTRADLAPETRAVVERNLAVIESALAEARQALDRDPANPALEAVVLAAYRRKIDFLRRASALDQEG